MSVTLNQINLKDIVDNNLPKELSSDANVSVKLEKLKSDPKDIDAEKISAYSLKPEETKYSAASLIKLFHSYFTDYKLDKVTDMRVAAHRADAGSAIEASLKESDNDALAYLVDLNTDTQSGLRFTSAEECPVRVPVFVPVNPLTVTVPESTSAPAV